MRTTFSTRPLDRGWKAASLLLMMGAALAGCTGLQKGADGNAAASLRAEALAPQMQAPPNSAPEDGVHVHRGDLIAGRVVRHGRGDPLPPQWEQPNSYALSLGPSGASLPQIATAIAERTGIPVVLVDGAELPAGSPPSSAMRQAESEPADVFAQGAAGSGSGIAAPRDRRTIPVRPGRLSEVLTLATAAHDADWRYVDGRIEIYRFVKETFEIEAFPLVVSMSQGSGGAGGSSGSSGSSAGISGQGAIGIGAGSGGSSGGGSGGIGSASQELATNYWENLRESLSTMLPPDAIFALSPASNRLTVVGRPSVINLVRNFVATENRTAGREVQLFIEVVSVDLTDSDQFGLDLNAVLANTGSGLTIAGGGPTVPFDSGIGYLDFSVVEGGSLSEWAGSSALVQALASTNRTSNVRQVSGRGQSNTIISVDRTRDIDVIRSAQTIVVPDSGTITSRQLETITTGFRFRALPRVQSDGRIRIMLSVEVSGLVDIITEGEGSDILNRTTIDRDVYNHVNTVRSGQSILLSGYIEDSAREARRGVGSPWNVLFGGALEGSGGRRQVLVVLTPVEIDP